MKVHKTLTYTLKRIELNNYKIKQPEAQLLHLRIIVKAKKLRKKLQRN